MGAVTQPNFGFKLKTSTQRGCHDPSVVRTSKNFYASKKDSLGALEEESVRAARRRERGARYLRLVNKAFRPDPQHSMA